MSTSMTSGRENSGGGYSPLESISRTFVPEKKTWEEGCDPQLLGLELVEDVLGVVGAVVAANPGVVAAHDKVRAAVVLAADRVEDRLPRPRVAHSRREDREHRAVLGVVAIEDRLV